MATRLPRLAVTLPADTRAVLAKLGSLQKRPQSAIAADLLVEMTPHLDRIAKLLDLAVRNRAKLPADTASKLETLEQLLGTVATFGMDRLEDAVQPAETPSAQARRRSAVRRRRGH